MKRPFSIIGSHITKIGIIVTILLISTLLNLRVDTSRDKAFSISKISKNLVRDLDEAMVVKIISTRNSPRNSHLYRAIRAIFWQSFKAHHEVNSATNISALPALKN
jgi:hypothetical protein